MAFRLHQSDEDIAFQLQLQEALTASLANQHISSRLRPSTSIVESPPPLKDPVFTKFQHEALDHNPLLIETQRMKGDLKHRVHDRELPRDIVRMPEADRGRNFERPFGEGCSKDVEGKEEGEFRIYFKGIISEQVIKNEKVNLAGIGVAICDSRDKLISEFKKPLIGDGISRTAAEMKALIEGLNDALSLELKRVQFFCDYFPFFQFVTKRWQVKNQRIAMLLNQVWLLKKRFVYCEPTFVARNEIKYAFKLAREAIYAQVNRSIESSRPKSIKETCVICFEDTDVEQMFSVDGCLHRYCFSCIKQHVEVKLLNMSVPKCPHEGCKSELGVESCKKFLPPMMIEMLKERIKEASIPVTEKVYCPYPRCSVLMSRSEISEEYAKYAFVGSDRSGARRCIKCHGLFCINCKVPWHNGMTCSDYKISNPNLTAEDLKLNSLATKNKWRQCGKCNNMIEHTEGCWHMTCICGHEFCYNCGAERKNNRPTCSCPAWDVRRIWFDNHGDFDDDDLF
ncbi:hypothetical protein SLA2020_116110 [Shorea laevis]